MWGGYDKGGGRGAVKGDSELGHLGGEGGGRFSSLVAYSTPQWCYQIKKGTPKIQKQVPQKKVGVPNGKVGGPNRELGKCCKTKSKVLHAFWHIGSVSWGTRHKNGLNIASRLLEESIQPGLNQDLFFDIVSQICG